MLFSLNSRGLVNSKEIKSAISQAESFFRIVIAVMLNKKKVGK